MNHFILTAKNIKKSFTIDKKKIDIIRGIDLDVKEGEFVAIMGSSGSGKSTLLSILAGLDKPDEGELLIDNENITEKSEDELSKLRNEKIGFIFQSFYLIPSLTAYENISFPIELKEGKNFEKKEIEYLLEKTSMKHRKNSYPNQLSGGEKQRVAICRALINKPQIIFADEPTGNLDSKNSQEIISLLLSLKKEFNTTLIVVTHEKKIAEKADRIIKISDGKIVK